MENFNQPSTEGYERAPSLFERISQSVILKVSVIFFLLLIMLIPLEMIKDLVYERKDRELSVSSEIAAKWGQAQVIASPILAVPYDVSEESEVTLADGTKRKTQKVGTEYAYLLPNQIDIDAKVSPTPLKRGIFQVIGYTTNIKMKGDFAGFDMSKLKIDPAILKWKESKLVFGIQDFKGLSKNPVLNWNGVDLEMLKNNQDIRLFPETLIADLPLTGEDDVKRKFDLNFTIRGSKSLNFLPIAKQTKINASGDWANPSFNGNYLPDERKVEEQFSAIWNIPAFTRKLPAQWYGSPSIIYSFMGLELNQASEFTEPAVNTAASASAGAVESYNVSTDVDMVQINFLPQINNYQKTTRVAKYGVLVIALTFMSLVFLEVIKKQRIHLIQYVLIGFAMVLFYGLLLAISEHLGFNLAYGLAALATMLLVSTFIRTITKNSKSAILFGMILTIFYVFIYVLLQLQDYSLLVGTIGLFIIIAVLMRLSSKIDWYQFDRKV